MNTLFKNPYRIFFFLGILGLFMGLSVWVILGFVDGFYFGRMHAHYMIGIFLLSFVTGFLMTAIPNMTGQASASKNEIIFQLIFMLSAAFWGLFEGNEPYFFVSMIASLLSLFVFCFKRIRLCTHMIPDVFPMVILSLFSGLLGSVLFLLDYADIGGRLFYLNLVLVLVVGVGAKLIPMILRLGCGNNYKKNEFWFVGLLLTGACFIESFWSLGLGSALRFLVILVVFFRYWKVHRFVGFDSSVTWGIRIASVSILMGTLGLWLFPDYRFESLHVLYVSGFGLLTIMVASRVILAHGNYGLELESKNWFIKIPIALIVLAAATRVTAAFVDGYERHLAYAAFTLLLGCMLWCYFFLPRLLDLRFVSKAIQK